MFFDTVRENSKSLSIPSLCFKIITVNYDFNLNFASTSIAVLSFFSFRVVLIIKTMFLLQKDYKRMVCLPSKLLKQDYRFVLNKSAFIFSPN